jgi:HK97 family phage major capsid protein
VRQRSVVRQAAQTVLTTRDRVSVGLFDWQPEWAGETSAAGTETSTAQTIGSAEVQVWKIRVKVRLSRDLLDDQVFLQGWLADVGGQALGEYQDRAFIAGSGLRQPLGMIRQLPSDSLVDVEGTTTNTISNTTANMGSASKLIGLEAGLADTYRAKARWFTTGATLAKVRKLVNASGDLIFPSALHPQTGEDTLLGHKVTTSAAMPLDGTDANLPIALCDASQYVVATRNTLSLAIDRETLADNDEVLLVLQSRVGGVLGVSQAIAAGVV